MKLILLTTQIVLAVILIVSILLQSRGSGLSLTFGGSGGVYRSKRGAEKAIFGLTIGVAILFLATSLALLFVS